MELRSQMVLTSEIIIQKYKYFFNVEINQKQNTPIKF